MKRYLSMTAVLIVSLTIISIFVNSPAQAFQTDVSASVDYVSSYIWRGQDLLANDEPAVQPGISMAFGNGLGLDLWMSYGFDGDPALDEQDYTLSYSSAFSGRFEYSLGVTYYTFPSAGHSESAEGFVSLSFPQVFFSPSLSLYGDWEDGQGVYGFIGGSYEWPIKGTYHDMTLSFSLGAGYSDGFWGTESGIADIDFGLALDIVLRDDITLTPSVNYVITPEDNANTENEFWFGVGLGFGL